MVPDMPKARQRSAAVPKPRPVPGAEQVGTDPVVPVPRSVGAGGKAALDAEIAVMDLPLLAEVSEQFGDLLTEGERWDLLVQEPQEPFVEVPDPTFRELIEQLVAALPAEEVERITQSVDAEYTMRRLEADRGSDEGGPVRDAERVEHAGAEVVDGSGGGDPAPQEPGDAVPAGG